MKKDYKIGLKNHVSLKIKNNLNHSKHISFYAIFQEMSRISMVVKNVTKLLLKNVYYIILLRSNKPIQETHFKKINVCSSHALPIRLVRSDVGMGGQ